VKATDMRRIAGNANSLGGGAMTPGRAGAFQKLTRALYRARRPKTPDGMQRQIARLRADAPMKIAAAQAKRERRAKRALERAK
jgi:hypothetical protein